jgi:hypothetical protein
MAQCEAEDMGDTTSEAASHGAHHPTAAPEGRGGLAVEEALRSLPSPVSGAGRLIRWINAHPRLPLIVALALGILGRLVLIVRTNAMIDGDEALVGIQAEHILRGEHPAYFYGQAYMGSLEAYLAAALFRVFGPSAWALRAVPLLLSLALVYLTWRLARALLPKDAITTPLLAGLAALLAALPPLYDAVAELRAWGGQIEVYVVTVALLLVTVELRRGLREGAHTGILAWRWALLGFIAGLGIWINPLSSYALVVCFLWLLPPLLQCAIPRLYARLPLVRTGASLFVEGGEGEDAQPPANGSVTTRTRPRATALVSLLTLLLGLALGGLPAWLYALRNAASNLLIYAQQPSVSPAVSGAARHGRLFLGAAITARYASCVAPRVLDGGLPAEPLAFLPLRALLLLPPLAALAVGVWLVARRLHSPIRAGLPLLYAAAVTAVFCLGTSAWASTKSCAIDLAGRYAVPLTLVLPLVMLALFAAPALWSAVRRRLGRDLLSAEALRRGWVVVLVALLLLPFCQLATYGLADPASTFQSPYYRHISPELDPLLTYLHAHDISAAWANHWLGNIVTFETDGATTCADYYDQVVRGGIQRPPGTLRAVFAANRPSFILISTDPYPLLAADLDARGIAYTLAVIPASGVTVITPTTPVNPADVANALGADYT